MGTTYHVQPIAAIEENTVRVAAGSVTFGLEMRELNPAIIDDFYEHRPERAAVQSLTRQRGEIDDGGPSIHVFGTDDRREYLRFDCFTKGPHYHYVHPHQEFQVVHEIDQIAIGDPFEWALGCLRNRLALMLCESGGEALAGSIDQAAVDAAIQRLAELKNAAEDGARA